MASTPSHTLGLTLIQIFSPSCDYWGRVTEYRAGEEGFAQIDILFGGGYEDVKGFVWWGDRMVGLRGFIAARSGINGTRGRGGGRLVRGQRQKTFKRAMNHEAMGALNQRTGFNLKMPEVIKRKSAMINKNRKRRINRVPRRSNMWHTLLCRH